MLCYHPEGIAPVASKAFAMGPLCTPYHIERHCLILTDLPCVYTVPGLRLLKHAGCDPAYQTAFPLRLVPKRGPVDLE